MTKQPWITNSKTDLLLIHTPTFVALALSFLFTRSSLMYEETPLWAWVIFILLIDVAHVHSTLFKTYFDSHSFTKHKTLYLLIPLLSYLFFVSLYWYGGNLWFWRILAYLAVFHFIRQQYGFVRLYNRQHQQASYFDIFDELIIYLATILPIIHWHLNSPRNFVWFIEKDFYLMPSTAMYLSAVNWLYISFVVIYLLKEAYCILNNQLNIPRILLMLGTGASWYLGIVVFNNDLVFTILNVVTHGIPYMGLIWIDLQKRKGTITGFSSVVFSKYGLFIFIVTIVSIAYFEEALWDATQWGSYESLFSWAYFLPTTDSVLVQSLLIPLLALPQITHYVLDGFIWKRSFEV
ncbi:MULTISPECIES: hypothetical protein [unclassified Arcicella]|uniref:hypothetical protein n=1 Tax=unclassified Arcicella TaxID=2644986 RepID=UPI00285F95D9|nr:MULTISPECIES: hypothetical protein [unclassified Arcicella]MDR6561603.1 hypothetical protein [Arcicella sp. BE51]MDR6812383.1 hypothetical protein [Arcicella sp. BE140]MDR6823845.1 hypothetical protein [Arcicella sp. BE139]